MSKPLNKLASTIRQINDGNGWNILYPWEWEEDPYKIPSMLALVHSEVSEALEDFRNDNKEHFAEELADIIIRVLDCSAGLDIDIDKEIEKKLEKNRNREYRHGGKRI